MSIRRLALIGVLLFAGPAAAEQLWTEGARIKGISAETPFTFGAFAKLAKAMSPAVVSISTQTQRPAHPFFGGGGIAQGAGSGFIIRADGYILSNNHVVEGAREVSVTMLDGSTFKAKVVGTDPATDLSVLKIDTKGTPLPTVPLGASEGLEIGEWVMAIGNPLGLSHTVTAGVVSAKGRREVRPDARLRYADFIQTDASINPGNSGGPLFNTRGEVVGINTAISARGQGIGFAIPINMVKIILPSLVKSGHVARSWLGVQIQEVTPELATSFGMKEPRGALVSSVVPDGPAESAGVQAGDVILAFNGRNIARHDDLPWLASTAGIGKKVGVEVMREGRSKGVQVTLGALPDGSPQPRGEKAPRKEPRRVAIGMRVGDLSRTDLRATRGHVGAAVREVDPGSLAARAGLRAGDIVLRFNGRRVKDAENLVARLNKSRQGSMIRLLVQRGSARTFIAFNR